MAHVEHFMSRVSMFLETRKFVSTLHFPFGNPLLPFEVREAVCLLEMSPFVPCLDSMSNEYIRVFGPRVPSFTLYDHVCSPPDGLTLHSVPLFTAESYYIVYMSSIFRIRSCGWTQTFFREKSVPGFSVRVQCAGRSTQSLCVFIWLCSGMGC